jgi:uncharacterized protein (DUF2164 family)
VAAKAAGSSPVYHPKKHSMKPQESSTLSKEKKQELRLAIQAYFLDELEIEIGDLQADFFIEFLDKQVGNLYYNAGVMDAMSVIKEKTEDLDLLMK